MGGAGDPPAPVGDPPTGTAESTVAKRPSLLPQTAAAIPSGESRGGTGGSPVPPGPHSANTHREPAEASRYWEQAVLQLNAAEEDNGGCLGTWI